MHRSLGLCFWGMNQVVLLWPKPETHHFHWAQSLLSCLRVGKFHGREAGWSAGWTTWVCCRFQWHSVVPSFALPAVSTLSHCLSLIHAVGALWKRQAGANSCFAATCKEGSCFAAMTMIASWFLVRLSDWWCQNLLLRSMSLELESGEHCTGYCCRCISIMDFSWMISWRIKEWVNHESETCSISSKLDLCIFVLFSRSFSPWCLQVHDLQIELPSIRDEMSLMREQAIGIFWFQHKASVYAKRLDWMSQSTESKVSGLSVEIPTISNSWRTSR